MTNEAEVSNFLALPAIISLVSQTHKNADGYLTRGQIEEVASICFQYGYLRRCDKDFIAEIDRLVERIKK